MVSTLRTWLGCLLLLAQVGCTGLPTYNVPLPLLPAASLRPDELFTMPDGARLPVRTWLPAGPPRAAVLALHGFNDSRDAWELPGPAFAAAGIALYAPDQRGFGAAPGRGRWPGVVALQADAAAGVALLRARHPGIPVYVMGESMGGALALTMAAGGGAAAGSVASTGPAGTGPLSTRPASPGTASVGSASAGLASPGTATIGPASTGVAGTAVAGTVPAAQRVPADGWVLLSPAVWGRTQQGILLSSGLWLVSTIAPGLQVTGGEVRIRVRASDNRDALLALGRNPLTIRRTRFDTLRGLTDLMDAAQDAAPALPPNTLALYGAHDTLVPSRATARAWRRMPTGVRRGYYDGGYHLLMRDLGRDRVIGDVIAWMLHRDAPLPSGADAAAAAWLAGDAAR